jgi:hypothetical protein
MMSSHNMKRIVVGALLSGSVALAGLGLSMGTAQAFNPQPDPPGKVAAAQRVNPGEIQGFNPQPDPPGLPTFVDQRG